MDDKEPQIEHSTLYLDDLIRDWASGGRARKTAEDEFMEFSPAQVTALDSRLAERKEGRFSRLCTSSFLLTIVVLAFIHIDGIIGPHPRAIGSLIAVLVGQMLARVLRMMWLDSREGRLRLSDVFDNQRRVRCLLENLRSYNARLRTEARSTLIEILPRLTTTDSDAFDVQARQNFHSALYEQPSSLVMPMLAFLRRNGDGRDLEPVERLGLYRVGVAAKNEEVRKAALELISILRERAEQEKVSGRLLRPSERPAEDSLLRPAKCRSETQLELLLRAQPEPTFGQRADTL